MLHSFTENLMAWNHLGNCRQMPWKGEKDPYRIWLSEIILQQTRVEQGWAYYEKFVAQFPTVKSLALARDEDVFKLWEGLGYYTRCKNLLYTARYIAKELNGVFPCGYNDIIKLKGIGPYTAAAISSFAFSEVRAVVDGNVQRVLARFFGSDIPVDTSSGKQFFSGLAQSLIPAAEPAAYNQAIMDFGASICKPRNPLCTSCCQRSECEAYKNGQVHVLPKKAKSIQRTTRRFNYFILRSGDHVYIRKRTEADIWQNLHEFVLLETDSELNGDASAFLEQFLKQSPYTLKPEIHRIKQQLTHQKIEGTFYVVELGSKINLPTEYLQVHKNNLHQYALPRLITSYLANHPL